MKKVISKKIFLSTAVSLAVLCCVPQSGFAVEMPSIQDTMNMIRDTGSNVKHDFDTRRFEQERQNIQSDYQRYQEEREEGGTQGSTVIKGAPEGSGDVIRAKVEELETSNEELQSTNEELIASNEELQSTNEELQSVNEELHTVNAEYRMKLDELTGMTEDMDNLLVSAEIGALYLDQKLCIRKITPIVKAMTNLVENDIGRSVFHVTFMEEYPQFHEDLRYVVESSKKIYRYLLDNRKKRWLIRIQPSRTEQNMVNGIILTMVDTTIADSHYVRRGEGE